MARLIPYALGAGLFLWGTLFFAWPAFEHAMHPPPFGRPPSFRLPQRGSKKWNARADAVRHAFLHAYAGYKEFAGQSDELLPLSESAVNK